MQLESSIYLNLYLFFLIFSVLSFSSFNCLISVLIKYFKPSNFLKNSSYGLTLLESGFSIFKEADFFLVYPPIAVPNIKI